MRRSLLLILLFAILLLMQQHLYQIHDSESFEQKLKTALHLLKKSKFKETELQDIFHTLYDDSGVHILPMKEADLKSYNGSDAGGIRILPDGEFDILVSDTLTPHSLAHVLAHEARHILDEIASELTMKSHPQLRSEVDTLTSILAQHADLSGANINQIERDARHTLVLAFIAASLMCSEVRAYAVNTQLELEGLLPINNIPKRRGIDEFINRAYLQSRGLKVGAEDRQRILADCRMAKNLGSFQEKLIERHF
jgi:hypothetical protein